MAREIKEILDGVDAAKLAAFSTEAATAADATAVKALAVEFGVELADDEAGAIFAELQKRANEEIALDELDNVSGGCSDDDFEPCPTYGPDPGPCPTYHC